MWEEKKRGKINRARSSAAKNRFILVSENMKYKM